MRTARDEILATIRQSLGRGPLEPDAAAVLAARMAAPPRHPRPAFEEDLTTRTIRKLASRSATVARVAVWTDVPRAAEQYRTENGVEPRVVIGAGLAALAWPSHWSWHSGPAAPDAVLSVTPAFAAIAETGTLMLLASPDSPTTHNFVPENQIIVLEVARILRHFEDAWLRLQQDGARLPRAVNLISGPSRTADIEQTIQLGAHGPRRLHVILVE